MTFMAVLRKEILEQVRTSRLVVLSAVLLFFGLTSPVIARYIPEILKAIPGAESAAALIPAPTMMDAIAQYIKNVGQFGVLMALLLTMGAVAGEKDRGTAAMMLVKPLPRPTFILTKFFVRAVMFALVMLVTALGAYYYTVVLFGVPNFGAWMAATALLWLHILVYIALTLLFSTLFRSQAAAIGLGFAVILTFALMGTLHIFSEYIPDQLLTWGATLLTPTPITTWPAFWTSVVLVLLSLVAAVLVFQKQEL